ncbi:MAG: 3-hydroxyacyl-CoA dehydrogenase [Syntrophales bacterium]|jgi:enoyl-CoA hydratase/3-hydroxyacyl-CoA dehydrogenase|nr:3-hydroxyacyl-CoA dehydrogenase [Syntrophales bacterium]MCK9527282.1 3-hydroxyacyl-CoA dehydrogenase [Syntrophales bacterium]MDX9921248.1 3-hydroxyacyl-CoA dehydrogenase NAD-binding domain-containing protein [Syntrophales bacterium]
MTAEDVKDIAVIGAGDMGHGIAACFIRAGYRVVLRDIEQEYIDRGVDNIRKSLSRLVNKGTMTREAFDEALSRLVPMIDLAEAVRNADFVIEAVPERPDLKKSVFAELDRNAPKRAILASNTSNISITDIAAATGRPDKVVGCHFFNPAMVMKLVEVTRGDHSSDESIQTACELARKIGKVPVIVEKDSPGFISNRVNEPTVVLLSKILEAGTPTPEEFDAAFKAFMPMTPFELLDYVGIDICYHGLEYFAQALSPDYAPSKALETYVREGRLGKKTGSGFFDWSRGRPEIDPSKATSEYDLNHLVALQVNEATKLIEEGVCTDPAQIDLAMINSSGSPFGPFALARGIGYDVLNAKLEELYDRFGLEIFKPTKTMKEGGVTT